MTSQTVDIACFGDYGLATNGIWAKAAYQVHVHTDEATNSVHHQITVDCSDLDQCVEAIASAWRSAATGYTPADDPDKGEVVPHRLDLCCVLASDSTESETAKFGSALAAGLSVAPLGPLDHKVADGWSSDGTKTWRFWPTRWHKLAAQDSGLWHTRSGLGAVGLWILVIPTRASSGEVTADALRVDAGGTAGPLAAYIDALGRARIHAMASEQWLKVARASDNVLSDVADADKLAAATSNLSQAVAGLQEATGNLAPVNANLHRTRTNLAHWLQDLGIDYAPLSVWDRDQQFDETSRAATVRGNHARYDARLADLMERSRHADARASQQENRANTRATLLLAIAAGALALGALASDTQGKVGLTVSGAGLLLALAVLVGMVPLRQGVGRWLQHLAVVVGGIGAGIGCAVAITDSRQTWVRFGFGAFIVSGAFILAREVWIAPSDTSDA